MKYVDILIASILIFSLCYSAEAQNEAKKTRINLSGEWTLTDIETETSYVATVPGTIHTDLLAEKAIPDPYFGNNEHQLKYLEQKNWKYTRRFYLDSIELSRNTTLECLGIDTYSTIHINGSKIGATNNMFRAYSFPIEQYLIAGENTIEIAITSPFEYLKEKVENEKYILPADNEKGEKKYGPYVRKAAYHFGWDWGPRYVTSGIWKDIYLQHNEGISITDYSIQTINIDKDRATLLLKTWIQADIPKEIEINLGDHLSQTHKIEVDKSYIIDTFTVSHPELWWPNGHGKPYLYQSKLSITSNGNIIDEKTATFGIKTVELINEPDSIGTSFYFVVNGKKLFAKGANYIPQDLFLPRVTDEQYKTLLTKAQSAHMNMIRVWGGGVYEKDLFYKLCDSLGLMVWQDFMFAGTMYPIDKEFIEEVSAEVEYQVNRLQKHPSIVLWCGNNEIQVAWQNWGWQKKYNYSETYQEKLWSGYEQLFKDSIPYWLKAHQSTIDYTSTSPLSNWGKKENFNHDSMHFWGVWHGREDLSSYRENVGRFMVEYGMQSYPEMSTIMTFAEKQDLHLDSEIMKNRQKSYIGNAEITRQIEKYFSPANDFADFVDKSQSIQAKALSIAIEAHIKAKGHCMGTILWQLNDCWPGPSWSIIDYYGNEKKAYGEVKEAFE